MGSGRIDEYEVQGDTINVFAPTCRTARTSGRGRDAGEPQPSAAVSRTGQVPLRPSGVRRTSSGYLVIPATRLMVTAMTTAPIRYDSSMCCTVSLRKALERRSVSDTWKVRPTVMAR